MAYPEPPDNKSDVRRAGLAIAENRANDEDYSLVDRWRASHGYVINTFQAWLKGHIARKSYPIEFAQRLKRRNTVIGKLRRVDTNGKPLMSDVSSMHDFAGCRMIFDSLEDLNDFRAYMHASSTMRNVEHQLRHEPEKYNYIQKPKFTGYRGIHDVYRHFPRGSNRRETKKPWDGLLVEIQYRTRAQHAWATAVEIADLLDDEQTKFELDLSNRGKFFAIASEVIARRQEGLVRAFLGKDDLNLIAELQDLEDQLGILNRLSVLKKFENFPKLKNHNVLNIYRGEDGSPRLEVFTFSKPNAAIDKASELESSENSINAVYVRSDNPNQLQSAYRNYFYDPFDFVEILQQESKILTEGSQ